MRFVHEIPSENKGAFFLTILHGLFTTQRISTTRSGPRSLVPVVHDAAAGVGGVILLAARHQPLDRLDILPLALVVQNVSHVLRVDLLLRRARVDAVVGDAERPRRVTDGELRVDLVRL